MKTKELQFVISIIALIASIGSVATTGYFASLSIRLGVKPVLVLVPDKLDCWVLQNVGNGPALNVLVTYREHDENVWRKPVRIYPISEAVKISLPWISIGADKIAVSYTDANNTEYTSITDNDLTNIHPGNLLPDWPEKEIKKLWQIHRNRPCTI